LQGKAEHRRSSAEYSGVVVTLSVLGLRPSLLTQRGAAVQLTYA
jgi:hypothetical protein